tara:strand:+ start:630 stop:1556 length:927 start_codon:yes stop_codon:yes gene_type:complete
MKEIPKIKFIPMNFSLPTISEQIKRHWELIAESSPVVPASSIVPEWYKNLDKRYTTDFEGEEHDLDFDIEGRSPTTKTCPGVFDFINAGYIIPNYCDMTFKWNNDDTIHIDTTDFIKYLSHEQKLPTIKLHEYEQAAGAPFWENSYGQICKIVTPWVMDFPKNVSVLIVHPYYHSSTDYTILPGILDVDVNALGPKQVNIFLKINTKNKTIFLKKGTPLAQLIPFERTNYQFECVKKPTEQEYDEYKKLSYNDNDLLRLKNFTEDELTDINNAKCPFGHKTKSVPHKRLTMKESRKQDNKNYNKKEIL